MEHTAITNNSRDLLRGVSSLVQTSPSSVWGEGMHVSGFFPYILALLFNAKTSGVVATEVVYLIARIAMADLQVFSQLMRAAAGPEVTSLENDESLLYKILLDKWWDKVRLRVVEPAECPLISHILSISLIAYLSPKTASCQPWQWLRWFPQDTLRLCRGCLARFSICGQTFLQKFVKTNDALKKKKMTRTDSEFPSEIFGQLINLTTRKFKQSIPEALYIRRRGSLQ